MFILNRWAGARPIVGATLAVAQQMGRRKTYCRGNSCGCPKIKRKITETGGKMVLFRCVGNSCRNQIAEALLKHYSKDFIEAKSAGDRLLDQKIQRQNIFYACCSLRIFCYNIPSINQSK